MKKSMMKNRFSALAILMLVFALPACSKKTSNAAICGASGMFSDLAECQASASGASCVMSTAQTETGQAVCYRLSSNQTTDDTGGGGTTPSSCQPPFTEVLTPALCSSTNSTQTVNRYCKAGCNCDFGATQSFPQNCTPDLYGASHYSADCTAAGGTVEVVSGQKACAFTGSTCPGWSHFKSAGVDYTITKKVGAKHWLNCTEPSTLSYTNEHATFQAVAQESRTLCTSRSDCGGFFSVNGNCVSETIYATVEKLLCY